MSWLGYVDHSKGESQMRTETKLFAFKLAEKRTASADATNSQDSKWKLRDGIAHAAYCTGNPPQVPGAYQGTDFHHLPC